MKGNDDVDTVSAGLVIMIVGLILIQLAPVLSDISYIPRDITGYEDKTTRIPELIQPLGFILLGILSLIIGCAVFLRNFINQFGGSVLHWLQAHSNNHHAPY